MSAPAFTPGPWKALIHETLADAREDSGFTWLHSEAEAARFLPLGCVWQDTGSGLTGLPGHVETTAANARLIAAAPTMHGLLVEIVAQCAAGGRPALATVERACNLLVEIRGETA